jgi:hypothetical protein
MLLLFVQLLLLRELLLLLRDNSRIGAPALRCWPLWLRDCQQCCEMPPLDSMLINAAARIRGWGRFEMWQLLLL